MRHHRGPPGRLVVVLAHSRLLWLQFYARQTMLVLMRGLEGAFAALGLMMSISQPAAAQCQSASHPNPAGTWLLEVTFLSGNPPPLNLMGSDGQGAWERLPGGMIGVQITKLVFCGPASVAFCNQGQEGQQLGYLRLTLKARVVGESLTVAADGSTTELVLGPDPAAPGIDFGPASATGFRLH